MRLALARALFVKVGLCMSPVYCSHREGIEAIIVTPRRAFQPQWVFYICADVPPYFTRSIVDLNALAWLEDYLQTWNGTLLVVYVA